MRDDLLPDLAEARREFLSSGDEDRLPIVDLDQIWAEAYAEEGQLW